MSKKGGCLGDCFCNLFDGDTIWVIIILIILFLCFCCGKQDDCC
ncbi:hypothetical protein [Ruminiclostridium herbifermentans]|nr:hypothetical protein [Ruminiclostridium herbifermentans]